MIQIRLLGALELTGSDGSSVLSVLSQPKRMGILAYLVAAHPYGFHSRDKLLALFWPESDADHARNALRQSLHFLRRSLGEEAIVSRGEDVAANAALFSCDVVDFDAAVEEGDWGQAVHLYHGPLLEGFHVNGAPDFDRWLEEERERIRAAAVRAGEEVSKEHEAAGDLPGAVEAARWVLQTSPANGRAAKRLIELLGRRGDRAGAILAYESFRTRLSEDFGLEPSEEVEEALDRVRRGEGTKPGGTPAMRGESKLGGRETEEVVLRPPERKTQGEHRGPRSTVAGEPAKKRRARSRPSRPGLTRPRVLLSSAVVVSALVLIWVAYLVVGFPRTMVLIGPFEDMRPNRVAGETADLLWAEITAAMEGSTEVRPVTYRTAWDYFLEATFRSDSLTVKLYAAIGDDPVGVWARAVDETLTQSELRDIAEDVVSWVEGGVAEPSGATTRLAGSTEDPVPESYARGRRLWNLRNSNMFAEAQALLTDAVREYPEFALGHAALADVFNLLGAYDYGVLPPDSAWGLASHFGERALRLDNWLPQALAARAATQFFYDWNFESAREGFLEAIERDTSYAHSRHWLGLLEAAEGNLDEALDQLNKALEVDTSQVFHAARARILYFSGDYGEAMRGYEKALEQDVDFIPALLGKGLSALMAGERETALREYAFAGNLLREKGLIVWALRGHLLGSEGDTLGAKEMLERLRSVQQHTPDAYIPPEYFAMVHLGLGNYEEALTELEQAFENGSNSMTILGIDPLLDPVRDRPRYDALLARVDSIKAAGGRSR
jgi:DNA-binding SARP family transcriptional activator